MMRLLVAEGSQSRISKSVTKGFNTFMTPLSKSVTKGFSTSTTPLSKSVTRGFNAAKTPMKKPRESKHLYSCHCHDANMYNYRFESNYETNKDFCPELESKLA